MPQNIKKSNLRLHVAEYSKQIKKTGELIVQDQSQLIDLDLDRARHQTLNLYTSRIPQ